MTRIASIGECMIELSEAAGGLLSRRYGGDTLNTAVYLARLGVAVDYFTALGVYSRELGFPAFRWQHVVMAGWNTGPWSVNLFNRLKSSYWDQNLPEFGAPYDENTVGGYSVWDLSGTWQGFKGLTVTGGVLNLFDEKAPFSNQGATFQVGYDPRFSNPIGRQYFVRLGYEFK